MAPTDEGAVGRPFTMAVERGKIREFARAVGSTSPAHFEDVAPLSPPTFLMSAAFWQGPEHRPPGLRIDLRRALHGEQEFVFHGEPPRAGVVLTGRTRIDRSYEKTGARGGRMVFTELVTEFCDPAGRPVAESRSTVIETARAPERSAP